MPSMRPARATIHRAPALPWPATLLVGLALLAQLLSPLLCCRGALPGGSGMVICTGAGPQVIADPFGDPAPTERPHQDLCAVLCAVSHLPAPLAALVLVVLLAIARRDEPQPARQRPRLAPQRYDRPPGRAPPALLA